MFTPIRLARGLLGPRLYYVKTFVVLGVVVDDLVSGNANMRWAYIPEMPTQKHVREPNARHRVHEDAVMMSRDVVFFSPCWFVL